MAILNPALTFSLCGTRRRCKTRRAKRKESIVFSLASQSEASTGKVPAIVQDQRLRAYSLTKGRRIVIVVPMSGVLSTLIEPLWSSITFFVM